MSHKTDNTPPINLQINRGPKLANISPSIFNLNKNFDTLGKEESRNSLDKYEKFPQAIQISEKSLSPQKDSSIYQKSCFSFYISYLKKYIYFF